MKSFKEKILRDIREIEEANENPVAFGRAHACRTDEAAKNFSKAWIRQTAKNIPLYVELMETELAEAASRAGVTA